MRGGVFRRSSTAWLLYYAGFEGLAFVTGWTGGYVLVALLLAPFLRKFGQFTIPDFLGARYEGHFARVVGVFAAVLASFVYVVAQIYGVGLITSRFIGIEFEIGVFVGLAGQVLHDLGVKELELFSEPREGAVRLLYQGRADEYARKIAALPESLATERLAVVQKANDLRAQGASAREIAVAERLLRDLPRTPDEARVKWDRVRQDSLARTMHPPPHAEAHPGADRAARDKARNNFIALVFVLMIGTAALPHILTRYYTTPSVREARRSVFWSLLFIFLLYVTAPAYAVFAKWEVYSSLVGSNIETLPHWVASWGRVGLVKIDDINGDGILQLAELSINSDAILLLVPELAGLPYVVSGLVAAGGLAAALSTADGLLLTISHALSHDLYYKMINPEASTQRRLVITKSQLLVVAVVAAWVASLRPDNILFMVGLAFSIAASAFFPALVLGIFWKRANKWGAVTGMIAGMGVTLFYIMRTHPFFGGSMGDAWLDIHPISSGVFGVSVGFVVIAVVSLLTPPPPPEVQALVDYVRMPDGRGKL